MPPELSRESSCRGWVVHARTHPIRHAFRYRVWMLLVDLDRVGSPAPPWGRLPVSVDRGHLLTRAEVEAHVERAGIDVLPERIFALTQPRSSGALSFNPVNFYFCYVGADCVAILGDVRSTPWNERHCYVLDARGQRGVYRFSPAKRLHVSPFLPMAGRYRWRVALGADRIRVAMRFDPGGRRTFFAALSLTTQPLTRCAALAGLARCPAQNAATLARIYWQAGRLFLKGAPLHPHPGASHAPETTDG
ncbi:MAG: DUF1365 domain-containing protein [Acidobacteria bacterium]|nr:DUF1365 domain-containing protein [Acidobacteriota bacterium]